MACGSGASGTAACGRRSGSPWLLRAWAAPVRVSATSSLGRAAGAEVRRGERGQASCRGRRDGSARRCSPASWPSSSWRWATRRCWPTPLPRPARWRWWPAGTRAPGCARRCPAGRVPVREDRDRRRPGHGAAAPALGPAVGGPAAWRSRPRRRWRRREAGAGSRAGRGDRLCAGVAGRARGGRRGPRPPAVAAGAAPVVAVYGLSPGCGASLVARAPRGRAGHPRSCGRRGGVVRVGARRGVRRPPRTPPAWPAASRPCTPKAARRRAVVPRGGGGSAGPGRPRPGRSARGARCRAPAPSVGERRRWPRGWCSLRRPARSPLSPRWRAACLARVGPAPLLVVSGGGWGGRDARTWCCRDRAWPLDWP